MSSSIRLRPGGGAQLTVKHRLLPKPFYCTFDDAAQAEVYRDQLVLLLKSGVVPLELTERKELPADDPLLKLVILEYIKVGAVAPTDYEVLNLVHTHVEETRMSGVSFEWADKFVRKYKGPDHNLSPSTIRKRVQSLARAVDWHIRQTTKAGEVPRANPLRMFPRGYSIYSVEDAKLAPAKKDVSRGQRLPHGGHDQVLKALAGHKRADKERAWADGGDPEFEMLYRLIVDTGLRLFEAYRLRVDKIDLQRWILHVDGSKGHYGAIKPRFLPIRMELREPLKRWCEGRVGLMFSYWDGSPQSRKLTQQRLSARFVTLFRYAGIDDFSEHDLRHEAACRWFTLRNRENTGWAYSEVEVCKVMGWSDTKLALRYASLRGEDLSARLG